MDGLEKAVSICLDAIVGMAPIYRGAEVLRLACIRWTNARNAMGLAEMLLPSEFSHHKQKISCFIARNGFYGAPV